MKVRVLDDILGPDCQEPDIHDEPTSLEILFVVLVKVQTLISSQRDECYRQVHFICSRTY